MKKRNRPERWLAVSGLLLGGIFVSTPSFAGWQYSQWEMTPEEITAASNGVTVWNGDRSKDNADLSTILVANYQASGISFEVRFMFTIFSKLKAVVLVPHDLANCDKLPPILSSAYGITEPKRGPLDIWRWQDDSNSNLVQFANMTGPSTGGSLLCLLTYTPKTEANQPGGL